MRRIFPLIIVLLAVDGAGLRTLRAADAPTCSIPTELIEDDIRYGDLAQRIRNKLPVTIVAIGGASTAGTAAGNGERNAWPRRLEQVLRQRHPGTAITVLNKGVPQQTVEEMAARFATDVYPSHPALVIWETGTVDAVRGADVEDFAAALRAGIDSLRQHNTAVLLVDMQFNPSAESVIDFQPYLEAMRETADLEDVYLFRRFDIMKFWSENGIFDLVDVPAPQRTALAAAVYQCIASRLADAIDLVIQNK